jgi:hypothetical protein
MRGGTLLVLALAGCNQAFSLKDTELLDADTRPDLDHDGIADIDDPCIAPAADLDEDLDKDGIPNGMDGCPITPKPSNTDPDGDGDGIPDSCDQFMTLAGDQQRCVMRWLDPTLTTTLWHSRDNERELAVARGYIIGFAGMATDPMTSIVSTERVVPDSGTNVIDVHAGALGIPFKFRIWISAGPTPSSSDAYCEVAGLQTGTTLSLGGVSGATPSTAPAVAVNAPSVGVRVIVQPGNSGTNVICVAGVESTPLLTFGHLDGPLAGLGFATPEGATAIMALVFYHRDDQPMLP